MDAQAIKLLRRQPHREKEERKQLHNIYRYYSLQEIYHNF